MQNIKTCKTISIPQGKLYLGESNEKFSQGFLELNPFSSLSLHNRPAIENLTQIKNSSVVIIFDKPEGSNYKLDENDKLIIKPKGTLHIHLNPFDKVSLTYWYFEGDIRHILNEIAKE